MREQSEGKETQQRTIGIATEDIDSINDTRGVDYTEDKNENDEECGYDQMYPLAQPLVIGTFEEVDTHARREGCQSAVGTRETRCHDTNREEDNHCSTQLPRGREHRQQVIAHLRQSHATGSGKPRQQDAEDKKKQVDRDKSKTVEAHVFLRLTQGLAGHVLLHHVLVQARHHDDNEDATKKLFPEVLSTRPIVKDKDTAVRVRGKPADKPMEIESETSRRRHDNKDERRKHAEGLERIGPYKCFDACATCVEPNEHDHDKDCTDERHMPGIEDEVLEDKADDIEPHRGTDKFGENEEGSSRLVTAPAETPAEVTVDRGEVQLVIDRQQEEGNRKIAGDETEAHLEISHVALEHHSRHRDKGDAGDGSPYHAEGDHQPRALSVTTEERLVACPP